ncbi:DUF4307 domain-containing protein [Streptacidiphilus sp. MAP5-3]|uniref:DUF4307 domain-containing protein n=1 Tax=unclassified Streptacidiphilus TaxID=2643834 RepID=UPI0035155A24
MADTTQGVRPAEQPADDRPADGQPAEQSAGRPGTPLRPPAGRYGTRDVAKARRRGKRIYYLTVSLALALVAAIAYKYISGSSVSGEVQTFQVVSAHEVRITLDVSKPSGQAASCTVRSRDENGSEVGRVTVAIPASGGEQLATVLLKTTSRGTTGELVGCS